MYRGGSKKTKDNIPVPMTTGRSKTMKSLEEAYGIKYETPLPQKAVSKSHVKSSNVAGYTYRDRGDAIGIPPTATHHANYHNYVITASDRYNNFAGNDEPSLNTTRRKANVAFSQDRQASRSLLEETYAEVLSKQEEYFGKARDPSVTGRGTNSSKPKTVRKRQPAAGDMGADTEVLYMKKDNTYGEESPRKQQHTEHCRHTQQKRQAQRPQQNHQHNSNNARDNTVSDKDEDTEEFIGLIKRAVEKCVVQSMTDALSRSIAQINEKIDRQAGDIRKLNAVVHKLHSSLSSKVAHYGEENSRHFRYLCMKSEYDKMFYQHHSELGASAPADKPPKTHNKETNLPTSRTVLNTPKNFPLHSTRTLVPDQDPNLEALKKMPTENMRDLVGQLKRFCNQYEIALREENANKSPTSGSSGLRLENAYHSHGRIFDDDETTLSSDGMTPRSMNCAGMQTERKTKKPHNNNNNNAQNPTETPNASSNGGGDA